MNMKQAKTAVVLFTLLIVVFMTTGSKAQISASDYFGLWTGKDNFKNTIEVTLNSNYSCIFKVDGVTSYNITGYKLVFDGDDGVANAGKCHIWFYSSNSTSPVNSLTLAPVASYTVYKSNAQMTLGPPDELVLTGNLPMPSGMGASNTQYSITLNK